MKTLVNAITICLLFTSILSGFAQKKGKSTFVIVHGAFGGAWAFKKVDSLLTANGHKVYRPTLTGLGERAHLSSADITLSTHILDVVNVILYEDLHDVTLIGHSYGGMVITGVSDTLAGRIKKLIYLDAMVPEDGESAVTSRHTPGYKPAYQEINGMIVPSWLKAGAKIPHDHPQPAKTFKDTLHLHNKLATKIPAAYIHTVERDQKAEEDNFSFYAERARKRKWKVVEMEADHNPQWSKPNELVRLFEENR